MGLCPIAKKNGGGIAGRCPAPGNLKLHCMKFLFTGLLLIIGVFPVHSQKQTMSDSALLTLVQQRTFNYFWKFGHPVSGMAPERTTTPETVTTGGSGFGVMGVGVRVRDRGGSRW